VENRSSGIAAPALYVLGKVGRPSHERNKNNQLL
jgi:hypothetical protein